MFTYDSTIQELLEDAFIADYLDLVFPKSLVEIVPEKYRNQPLRKLPDLVQMPWGTPYIAGAVLDSVKRLYELKNDGQIECVPLWKERYVKDFFPEPVNSKESVCLFVYRNTFRDNRPVALIVPGGGYAAVSIAGEGMDTADVLKEKGYAVAILNYRCKPNYYPAPQEDLALAIKYIRTNAGTLKVNGNDILLVGYSAGGHLAASETLYESEMEKTLMEALKEEAPELYKKYRGISVKANKLCLSYPFTGEEEEPVCFGNLLGSNLDLMEHLTVFLHVDETCPKTFLWACEDDPLVKTTNTTKMADALKEKGVSFEMKLYPSGGHGIGVAKGTSAEGWVDEMTEFFS